MPPFTIVGTPGADSLRGNGRPERIFADEGQDTVDAGGGDDTVFGEGTRDRVFGAAGDDSLLGGDGTDQLAGGSGADTVVGQADDDSLDGDAGADLLLGGEGADFGFGGKGRDTLRGEAGDDELFGGDGDDLLEGGDGADELGGDRGADTLTGGEGADSFQQFARGAFRFSSVARPDLVTDFEGAGAAGGDVLDLSGANPLLFRGLLAGVAAVEGASIGGAGNGLDDLVLLDASGPGGTETLLVVDLDDDGVIDAADYALRMLGDLSGLTEADFGSATLFVTAGTEADDLLAGDDPIGDALYGLGGDDTLLGGRGDDTLVGGDGRDVLRGGAGFSELSGGDGDDDLSLGQFGNAAGGAGNDRIRDGSFGGSILGEDGNDTLVGSAGSSVLDGGAGDDRLVAGLGSQAFVGGDGRDTLDFALSDARVLVDLAAGLASGGFVEGDVIDPTVEDLAGSRFADVLAGDAGDNRLTGRLGNDTLAGGAGADTLEGGGGADVFAYRDIGESAAVPGGPTDLVLGFRAGVDRIDLSAIDADPASGGNQGFLFLGEAAFSATGTAEVRFIRLGGTTLLEADLGDGVADLAVVLAGTLSLTGGDVVL
jgi:Ca2+-binding RTX toxin-like protein